MYGAMLCGICFLSSLAAVAKWLRSAYIAAAETMAVRDGGSACLA
jgi:hypothetical protein